MEQLLTAIIDRLEENRLQLGLSMVDEEFGQVDMIDSETDTYPVTFPAVFVDTQGESWQDLGQMKQRGTSTINLNIYLDCYDDTHMASGTRHMVHQRMMLVRQITELFQGWHPFEHCGMMTRVASTFTTGNHGIKQYQVTFTIALYDDFLIQKTHNIDTHDVEVGTLIEHWVDGKLVK